MTARQRVIPAVVGLVLFGLLGYPAGQPLWLAWWFYVGLGVVLSSVFVEPFYGRAQDAIVNSVVGIGAWASATRDVTEGLWTCLLIFYLIILASGLFAALATGRSRSGQVAKRAANYIARTFGRAVVVGGAALAVQAMTLALRGDPAYLRLSLATIVLVGAVGPNWSKALAVAKGKEEAPVGAVGAIGPRLVQVRGHRAVPRGTEMTLRGTEGTGRALVLGVYPTADGPQLELALDTNVDDVLGSFDQPLEVSIADTKEPSVLGVVGPGTTDLQIVFHPTAPLRLGDPLQCGTDAEARLYQVTSLELSAESRFGGSAVLPRAKALLVGTPGNNRIETRPALPEAHERVRRADPPPQAVPTGYTRIGHLKNTRIEVGIDCDAPDTGHFAILGISGMGKTSVAIQICRALSRTACVIALDTTGEYRSRQQVPIHVPGSSADPGFWVHEPTGDPPAAATKYIEATMNAAYQEYSTGKPNRRVLLLEEAHGFVPETNISTFAHRDATAESTRYIMQARKFEIRFVLVSQRTAVVSKSALSQCENYIVLRSTDETSLTYLEAAVGRGIRDIVPRLQRYEAVCVGPAFNTDGPVVVSLDPPSRDSTESDPSVEEGGTAA